MITPCAGEAEEDTFKTNKNTNKNKISNGYFPCSLQQKLAWGISKYGTLHAAIHFVWSRVE